MATAIVASVAAIVEKFVEASAVIVAESDEAIERNAAQIGLIAAAANVGRKSVAPSGAWSVVSIVARNVARNAVKIIARTAAQIVALNAEWNAAPMRDAQTVVLIVAWNGAWSDVLIVAQTHGGLIVASSVVSNVGVRSAVRPIAKVGRINGELIGVALKDAMTAAFNAAIFVAVIDTARADPARMVMATARAVTMAIGARCTLRSTTMRALIPMAGPAHATTGTIRGTAASPSRNMVVVAAAG